MSRPAACDVLVIGAGPAGSSAARAAARQGARVTLVDRRRVVGVPVQCAEHVPAMLLLGEEPDCREAVVQKIRGMRTYVRGELANETEAPGFIIERDRFDQALAASAERAGATLLTSTTAVAWDGEEVILRQRGGTTLTLAPDVIVAADGPRSTAAAWCGIGRPRVIPAVQARVRLVEKMDFAEVYLHPDFRGGYAWLFPRGEFANAGLGFLSPSRPVKLSVALRRFLQELQDRERIAGPPLAHSAGWIPATSVSTCVHQNLVLAGDAAGQTHPITGAGMLGAMSCGRLAGKWAATALQAGDMRLLRKYDDEWRELLGDMFEHGAGKRRYMEAHWDDFDATVQSCWVSFDAYHD